jgi:hypothetical protein
MALDSFDTHYPPDGVSLSNTNQAAPHDGTEAFEQQILQADYVPSADQDTMYPTAAWGSMSLTGQAMWTSNASLCQPPLESQQDFPPFAGCGVGDFMHGNQALFSEIPGENSWSCRCQQRQQPLLMMKQVCIVTKTSHLAYHIILGVLLCKAKWLWSPWWYLGLLCSV